MNTPNQAEEESPPSKNQIIYSVENGTVVLKKKKSSDPTDDWCFSAEYFESVGFPGTTVYTLKMSPDGIMRGGYYKNIANLTYPFNSFVSALQGNMSKTQSKPENVYIVENPSDNKPGFFERLGNYGSQISSGVSYGVDNVGSYFKTKKEKHETDDKQSTTVDNDATVTTTSLNNSADNEKIQETKKDGETDLVKGMFGTNDDKVTLDEYWIVRIPIPVENDDNEIIPFGKYEKMEAKITQMERERKVDKLNNCKFNNKLMYEVGKRYVGICVESSVENKEIIPLGSMMSKLKVKS